MIRSLEKNKDRLGLLPQKKQKEMCIRETGSGRKVQVLRLLTWENNRTWGPMKVPRATNARWCEIKARVSAESENRFYAHVPVNGCTLTARELSSCLSFLVFFPQSLTEIILWHTFPSTPDGPIHHYQHCQPPWSFSNIQRPSAAISFSLLLSTWFYCKSRSWLMSGVYHTSISLLLGYFGGVQHLNELCTAFCRTQKRDGHTPLKKWIRKLLNANSRKRREHLMKISFLSGNHESPALAMPHSSGIILISSFFLLSTSP